MGKRLVIFMKSSEFSFPSACIYLRCPSRIPLLRASYTVAVPSPPRLSENLSAAIILSWRAKSSHLTKSTGTCLEIPRLRDDRMIVSEEFSDNLPRCPPPVKTAFPALLRRLMVVWEDFDKEMRDLCKISWILFPFLLILLPTSYVD